MAKKKSKKSMGIGSLFLIALLVFAAFGTGAYLYNTKFRGVSGTPELTRPQNQAPLVDVNEEKKVTIFVPEVTSKEFYLKPMTRTGEAKGDILDVAVETLLATNLEEGEIGALIPKGTRLLSPVKVSKGIATVNLSKEFIDNFSGGTNQEALTVNSIAHTVVKNSGGKVKGVQILVEGKTVETLGGDSDLTTPINVGSTMLKPGN
ncbi:MAG: GerMN domain-containing protein [Armatimonadetes bacterium]|nr:GerMN domain-containing protein [Armatimonadota bacterium]